MTKLFRNTTAFISPLLFAFTANAQSLPEFSLKCSESGNQSNYRLASNGAVVYFATIDSRQNIGDVRQSIDGLVEPRTIVMSFRDSSAEPRRPRMSLEPDSAHEVQGILARDTLIFQLGKHQYACEKIADSGIFSTLKLAYESSVIEAQQKKKIYNNRPNQL